MPARSARLATLSAGRLQLLGDTSLTGDQNKAFRSRVLLQLAITYIVVLGFEAITALVLSMVLLNESASISKVAGVALVVAAIVLLRTGRG
jgi:hypothetical protein